MDFATKKKKKKKGKHVLGTRFKYDCAGRYLQKVVPAGEKLASAPQRTPLRPAQQSPKDPLVTGLSSCSPPECMRPVSGHMDSSHVLLKEMR